MRIFSDNPGACIEPGGYELSDYRMEIKCEQCGKAAHHHNWETVDGGCINQHWRTWCDHCGTRDESMFASGGGDRWAEIDYDFDYPDDGEAELAEKQRAYEQLVERFGYAVAGYARMIGKPRVMNEQETQVVTPQFKFWCGRLLTFRLYYLPF